MQVVDGKFTDHRWKNGAWDLESDSFKKDGKTNWDLVGCFTECLCICSEHNCLWQMQCHIKALQWLCSRVNVTCQGQVLFVVGLFNKAITSF